MKTKTANLESKVKWADREDKNISPLEFYRQNYDSNMTRGELSKKDAGLYQKLWREGLLEEVPVVESRFGDDPLEYYRQNYKGMTRGQLQKKDPSLYQKLWRDGLLEEVSTSYRKIENPLKYYIQNYKGLTRGQLKKKDPGLYKKLRRDGLLEEIPLKKKN